MSCSILDHIFEIFHHFSLQVRTHKANKRLGLDEIARDRLVLKNQKQRVTDALKDLRQEMATLGAFVTTLEGKQEERQRAARRAAAEEIARKQAAEEEAAAAAANAKVESSVDGNNIDNAPGQGEEMEIEEEEGGVAENEDLLQNVFMTAPPVE